MKIKIENSTSKLRYVYDNVSSFCDDNNVANDIKLTLNLIIEEYITNTIVHGSKVNQSNNIEIELKMNHEFIHTIIIDNADEFNPLEHQIPNLEDKINSRIPGGLGVLLINEKTDKKEYTRKDNKNIFKFSIKKN